MKRVILQSETGDFCHANCEHLFVMYKTSWHTNELLNAELFSLLYWYVNWFAAGAEHGWWELVYSRVWRQTGIYPLQLYPDEASFVSGERSARILANGSAAFIVRRAGLLWSQQDFEWRWSVPLFKCLTVLEFSVILFDLCLLITFFNFIMNYVPIVTFWIFTYHKIWILSIMFCFIWGYWIIYFLACLEVSWRVVS